MKLLALEKDVPGVSDSSFTEEVLKKEAVCVWLLYKSGVIRELYFRAYRYAWVRGSSDNC